MVPVENLEMEEQNWLKNVYQGNKIKELTIKVLIIGTILGALLIASNIYMGLKTGFTEGGSIISAILAFAIIKALKGKFSVLENNMAQTMASAAASIGIMVSAIPALIMLGYNFTGFELFLWIFLVSVLGILFAIPLRKQMVVIEKITFPSGTACAATIKAMHSHGDEAIKRAKVIGLTGLFAGLFTWFRDAVPVFIPSMTMLPGKIGGHPAGRLMLGINWSPMLFGVGFLVGPRIGLSLLLGAAIGWGILAPVLANAQIIEGIGYRQITSWTMWVAVAIMVTSSFTSLALRGGTIVKSFQSMRGSKLSKNSHIEISFRFWLVSILVTSIITAIIMSAFFNIPIWMTFLAIVLSFILAVVAIRAYGETDISPVGAMGYTTQLIYGGVAPGNMITNVMSAGITAGSAQQSSDMMQDLKTGYLLGATPRKQVYVQFIGSLIGAIIAVPVFLAITGAYGLGTENLPAPSAVTWSGMAKLLSQGFSVLPPHTWIGILCGAFLGILLTILGSTKLRKFTPSPIGLGIAMVVPGFFSISIFLGSMIHFFIGKTFPKWMESYKTSVASGGIAGEGVMGVIISILKVSGVF
ncbi:OPT family oligopeptide transporter [bacterium]